jgi:cation transport ATPase
MLMTRILYVSLMAILLALNGSAVWEASSAKPAMNATVFAALLVNIIAWPIALVVAYRVGQFTGVERLHKSRKGAAR